MKPLVPRRRLLSLGLASGAAVALGARGGRSRFPQITASDARVGALDTQQRRSGRQPVTVTLTAAQTSVDLAGRVVRTWAYGERGGLPELRVRRGDVIEARLVNDLPEPTTIHWHGIAIRNDMDGVHGLTQHAVAPGAEFMYRFTVPDAGTFFFHPHFALQLDRALYAPLIVEDPDDPVRADVDQVLVLDDWLDDIDGTPEDALDRLRAGGGMDMGDMDTGDMHADTTSAGGMHSTSGLTSELLGGDAGDIAYPLHLINGRPPADRPTVAVPAGAKVRLRIVNAGSDTAYRFAVGGHRLTVTHADGFPVQAIVADALLVGMGERYDVVVTARSGAWPIVAAAEGKGAAGTAVLRTGDAAVSSAPPVDAEPAELGGVLLTYRDLRPTEAVRLGEQAPERTYDVDLTGDMMAYDWGIGGQLFPDTANLEVYRGERVRLVVRNQSSMWHPMHLHGHTFALTEGSGAGARKDTVNVLPNEQVAIDFDAENPGEWMFHCHNTYHLESGMATVVSYVG